VAPQAGGRRRHSRRGGRKHRGGGCGGHPASVDAPGLLLPASMYPAAGVMAGGRRSRRQRQRRHRGGNGSQPAPLSQSDMLLPKDMYAQAQLNPQWNANPANGFVGGGKRKHRRRH
jgi:hypothetical protein